MKLSALVDSMGKLHRTVLAVAAWAGFITSASAADSLPLDPHLQPLAPWLGKTWKGEFKNSTPEKLVIDVARWERALNGKVVRVLHSINDGVYGGETLFMWDEKKQTVTYHYFTTAGFMTVGSVTFKDGNMETHEVVSGNAGGTTEIKGTAEMRGDGTFQVKTEYLKDGAWTPGREAIYRAEPSATVVFK